MSSLRKKGPARKGSTRYTTKPPSDLPEFEMLGPSGKSNGFVIQISEGRPSISELVPPPPASQDSTSKPSPRQKPQPPPLTIPQKAHIPEQQKPVSPPSPPTISPKGESVTSPANVPLPRSSAPTPQLAGEGSAQSPKSETPVMRSMFPRYDPNRPLTRQSYYPHLDSVPGLASAMAVAGSSASRTSNNPYRQQMAVNRSFEAVKTSLDSQRSLVAEVKESPLRSGESTEQKTTFSTTEELGEIWNIANGQAPSEEVAETYSLELSCDDLAFGREIITFNNSSSEPLYTLEASHSNIIVSRIQPSSRTPSIQIDSSSLCVPTSVDPLVTSIFPKLAGLMALDQASNVAVTHKLDRQASADLQTEAVARAQEQEASMLLWDDASNKYCLMHPTLLDSSATTFPIEIIPTPSNPSKITIYAPETHTPLLVLTLQNLSLTIHTRAITALPSLYILDTLLTTLLSLLLHLHRSCANPASRAVASSSYSAPTTPMFPPPPTLAHKDSRSSLRSQRNRSTSRLSVFQRSSNNNKSKSIKSARSIHSASAYEQDIELQSLPPVPAGNAADGEIVAGRTGNGPPKQIFSAEDESLPKATRAVLKLLYWVFEVAFWALGVLVQVLAAGVVGAGKLLTRL
ncbi:hypothetical protein ACLMJK_003029 [Lecanora helva]